LEALIIGAEPCGGNHFPDSAVAHWQPIESSDVGGAGHNAAGSSDLCPSPRLYRHQIHGKSSKVYESLDEVGRFERALRASMNGRGAFEAADWILRGYQ
jgi:hypothetical protein